MCREWMYLVRYTEYPYQARMKRVFEAPLYTGVKGQPYVKAWELTKADIAKIQKCIKDFV